LRPNNLVVVLALLSWAFVAPDLQAKAKKPVQHRKNSSSASSTKNGKKKTRVSSSRSRHTGPPRQQSPSQDRYAEIQKALADKGYYQGPITGQWGAESVAALKRFQEEQHLAVDGKIGAKSLIALGLGPKRDALIGAVAKPNEQTPQGQQ
jgi:peptidoglycan hydrolase-like protein with peptidoglycan-binding domain